MKTLQKRTNGPNVKFGSARELNVGEMNEKEKARLLALKRKTWLFGFPSFDFIYIANRFLRVLTFEFECIVKLQNRTAIRNGISDEEESGRR